MGIPVLIYGKSGTGKSRSLKNFGRDDILHINVLGKPLPFRGGFRYSVQSDDYKYIMRCMESCPADTIVIDDAGYLLTNRFMRGHSLTGAGSSVYDLYNDIADRFWDLFRFAAELPRNKTVYFLMHEDTNDYGTVKLKTIGRLLDEKVCIEGMATVALRCMTDGKKHWFRTQSDGMDISKSPEGMFEPEIENDLKFVDDTIRAYYEITKEEIENA